MGDQEPLVYTDPQEPGAPQVGDMVVVVHKHRYRESTLDGVVSVVTHVDTSGCDGYPWFASRPGWVHAVRRPTEAELAAWVLSGPGESP